MMTPKYEAVQAVRIRAACDCGGVFKHTGQDDLTNKTFTHRCSNCGTEIRAQTIFPAIEHFNEAEMKALVGQ